MAYYMTEKERKAAEYFGSLETFTETQAENAIKFCCSICGCDREEQQYLLDWYFDACADWLMAFGNTDGEFWRVLDACGDSWIVTPDDPNYEDTREAMFDCDQLSGEILPNGNLFVHCI